MKRLGILAGALTTLAAVALILPAIAGDKNAKKEAKDKDKAAPFTVSGPYTHSNLSVFLIHGANQNDKKYLTLDEALTAKKVVVHETGNVQELSIENVSTDEVYVQAGDIVKGGKQDRVLTVDVILPKKSGKLPVASFCVEQGRWSARSGESVAAFGSSANNASTKAMKMAFREKGQSDVWKEVKVAQDKLSKTTGVKVNAEKSESSYQLALENKVVKGKTEDYVKALEKATKGKDDVIGYAFAINGEVNSADVYANHNLFTKLWPKLLKGSVIEAIGEDDGKKHDAVKRGEVETVLKMSGGKVKPKRKITDRVMMDSVESPAAVMYETTDEDTDGFVHKSYIKK